MDGQSTRTQRLAAILDDMVSQRSSASLLEVLDGVNGSAEIQKRLHAYRVSLEHRVNRAFSGDADVSASEHNAVIFSLMYSALTDIGTFLYEAGKRVGQIDWMNELDTLEDDRVPD